MTKKLHILFLCNWFPSRVKPTSGDFVQRHAEAVATKHKVTVIHTITDENIDTIEIITEKHKNVKTIIGYIPKTWNPLLKYYHFIITYKRCIKKVDFYDMVHLNVMHSKGIVALYLKLIQKKPYIVSEHWTDYQYPLNRSIGYFQKKITQLIVKKACFVCPVSNSQKKDMQSFGLKGNYHPVPNVVDTQIFYPIKKSNEKYVITHASSFTNHQKNISGLLEVIKQLSLKRNDFLFKIFGNNDYNWIKKQLQKLNIPNHLIQLEGCKSHQETAHIFQNADLYISFSNYESFGIVMAEAIAAGIPVISTNTGILTELNIPQYSTIIPIKDQEKLLEKIMMYLDSKKEFDGNEMNTYIKNKFSIDVICNSFTKLYYQSLTNNC